MGGGASSEKAYHLRSIDDVELESPTRSNRSRKPTAIYPTEREVADAFDTKPKGMSRRNSNVPTPLLSIDSAAAEEMALPVKKKGSLARMNSKVSEQSAKTADTNREQGTTSPMTPPKGQLMTAQSSKNMLLAQPSNKNMLHPMAPAPLIALPSSRASRSNSVVGRSSSVCSLACPWLLKNANTAGTSMSDYELGRVIGKTIMLRKAPPSRPFITTFVHLYQHYLSIQVVG